MSRECPVISPAISRCTPALCLTAVLSPSYDAVPGSAAPSSASASSSAAASSGTW